MKLQTHPHMVSTASFGNCLFLGECGFLSFRDEVLSPNEIRPQDNGKEFPLDTFISYIELCKQAGRSIHALILTDKCKSFDEERWLAWMNDVILAKEVLIPDCKIVVQLNTKNLSTSVMRFIAQDADIFIAEHALDLSKLGVKENGMKGFDFMDYVHRHRLKFKGEFRVHWMLFNDEESTLKKEEIDRWLAAVQVLNPQQMRFQLPKEEHEFLKSCRCEQLLNAIPTQELSKVKSMQKLNEEAY